MVAVRIKPEEVNTDEAADSQPAAQPQAEANPRQFKPDPAAGRKLSFDEALERTFSKNAELMRRLS